MSHSIEDLLGSEFSDGGLEQLEERLEREQPALLEFQRKVMTISEFTAQVRDVDILMIILTLKNLYILVKIFQTRI